MNSHHNFFETLALRRSEFYLTRGSSSGEPRNVQVVDNVFVALILFCRVRSVVCNCTYCSEPFFNIFLFIYTSINYNTRLLERKKELFLQFHADNFATQQWPWEQLGLLWPRLFKVFQLFIRINGEGTNKFTELSCIYTVHLTRSFNRQTNTCTLLIFYLLKFI